MISIIVPVYNVEKYLFECINSILIQSYQDFEIICIDDASTDSSGEILDDFTKKDPRIKIIKNEKNIGLGPSRNRGIEAAKGEYILFLDGDDWYSPDALEIFSIEAEKNNLDVVIAKAMVYYDDKQKLSRERYYDMDFMNKFEHKIFNYLDVDKTKLFFIPIAVWAKLYSKSFLDENNIRFPNKNYLHEDNPFSSRVITHASSVSLINKHLYVRRRRADSLTTLRNERLFDNIDIVYLILEEFLENREYYNYFKKEVLNYIFKLVLNLKYNQIEDKYKEKFYDEVQGVYRTCIKNYGLYEDIKENVDINVLNFFKFEDIVNEFSIDPSK